MCVLYEQWLDELHVGRCDIAGTVGDWHLIRGRSLTDLGRVDAHVVDPDAFVVGEIVVDHHLSIAHDGDLADLVRIQPAHVDESRCRRTWEVQSDEGDIGVHVAHVALCPHGGGLRELAQQVGDDGDVVRREVPDYVAVVLVAAEAQTRGVDVQDATELTGVDDLLEFPYRGVVLEGVSDHQGPSSRVRCLHERFGDRDRGRQWFLDHGVQPGPQCLQRDRAVAVRRGGDDDGVQLVLDFVETRSDLRGGEADHGLAEPIRSIFDDREFHTG